METKNCPFCGGEIKAVAKKCKHCGRWLENPPQSNQLPADNVKIEDSDTKTRLLVGIIIFAIGIIILILSTVTCSSSYEYDSSYENSYEWNDNSYDYNSEGANSWN